MSEWLVVAPVMSLPTRERELKHLSNVGIAKQLLSLPTRERELKHGVAQKSSTNISRSLHGSVN